MKVLIDTQIFIWFIQDSPNLKRSARILIEDENNEIVISIASLWEISIKNSIGKLNLVKGFSAVSGYLQDNLIEILPITFAPTLKSSQLPFHHRDPFDRMIVSQAIVESLNLISSDDILDEYLQGESVKRL